MKPINTALCSFGMSGKVFHAPFLDVSPMFSLYGVWERTKNEAEKVHPGIKTFRSLESLLEDDNIELVIVNAPSITHYNIARQVIEKGKHLIVEKPFTATTTEAEELILLAKERNVVLSVYHNRRYDSDFKTVKEIVSQGVLGNLIDVEMHFDRFEPALSQKKHKELPTPAVGSLYDLGSHLIDQALQLFGWPKAIYADLDTYRPNSRVTDYFELKLFYNTHRVTLKSSYYVRETLAAYILHGTKGSFIKSKADVQEKDLQRGIKPGSLNYGVEPDCESGLLHTEKNGHIVKEYIPTFTGNYMNYYNAVYDAIRNNGPVPVSAEDGMLVIKLIEAALQSNRERCVINL
ncbi:MAG: Gfo/Idh/MocA family oxidoreductase [Flavobacteriaceae bacterium]|nr:Gfo/Idh/MocA family oxidoreductase [Flavobacteriaceae bacterium]